MKQADFNGATLPMPDRTMPAPDASPAAKTAEQETLEIIAQRYKPLRIIGRGGFGMIYLAEDMTIGRLVAIKRLRAELTADKQAHVRFLQEARIAGQIEHPNIIILYDIEEWRGNTYMVMEYLGGGNLDDLIAAHKRIEPRAAIRIMLGILAGLDAAHHLTVIHRDIKPQNILFGIAGIPKITDFGIAYLPTPAGGETASSPDREKALVIGSPVYMAPEQALGEPVDSRADIYSAGAVFYEMLAGERMIRAGSEMTMNDIRRLILEDNPVPIRDRVPNLHRGICAVVERMTAKSPADRFASTGEVKAALMRALAGIKKTGDAAENEIVYPPGLFWNSPAAILEDVIFLLLLDGAMSDSERRELDARAEHLGISRAQARAIENNVRQRLGLPPVPTHLILYT